MSLFNYKTQSDKTFCFRSLRDYILDMELCENILERMLVIVLVMAFLLLEQLRADAVKQHHFKEIHGYYIEGGNILESIQREGKNDKLLCVTMNHGKFHSKRG